MKPFLSTKGDFRLRGRGAVKPSLPDARPIVSTFHLLRKLSMFLLGTGQFTLRKLSMFLLGTGQFNSILVPSPTSARIFHGSIAAGSTNLTMRSREGINANVTAGRTGHIAADFLKVFFRTWILSYSMRFVSLARGPRVLVLIRRKLQLVKMLSLL